MKLPDAKRLLERVIELKQAVAYRRFHKEVPHRRQLNEHFYAGRFPQKAAGRLFKLLEELEANAEYRNCLLYTSPSPRDLSTSRMPSSA